MAAEALILSMIQKLECSRASKIYALDENDDRGIERIAKERVVMDELKSVVGILREKKLGEGSDRLNYFISDLLHMVLEFEERDPRYLESILCWMREIKMRMLKLETESNMISENVGEGDEEDVVGLEEDVQLLLRTNIFNDERWHSSLLIKGMVGIGKTTLARQLYNHAAVVDAFECRAWVCVSTDLTLKEVLIKLIQQVVHSKKRHITSSLLEEMENADIPALQHMLDQHLQEIRYLIVLDDLPKHMPLHTIFEALPIQFGIQSKLLFTSTSLVYIKSSTIHEMKSLDSKKSWQLFLKTIFRGTSEQEFPKHLEKKGKEMLTKCDGLPLAIKEVGRQLAEKRRSGSEWEQLLESIDLDSTVELLESSYHRLDPELKPCFLHLAFFKENITMRAEKLKQIWLVGGVLKTFDSDKCLSNLINDSVIEVKGKRGRYRMNTLLRRLSIKKAEEEIGFEILSSNGNNRPSKSPRHRVMICSREKFNYSRNQDKYLVSLFFHGGGYLDVSPSYWKSFEKLEILDFEDFGLKVLPESISRLMELRYLGLRNNYIQELPDWLGQLKKLEVLDIALNFMVVVPDTIWEIGSLCHLYMSAAIFRSLIALENLEALTFVSVKRKHEVGGRRLHTLGIEEVDGNSDVSKLFKSLALSRLYSLILRGFRFRSMPCLDELRILKKLRILKLDGLLAKLPSANNFPPELEELKLVNSCLDEDPMPLLGMLPNLLDLKLRNAYRGRQMVILHYGFPRLNVLCIEELWNLRNVQVGEGSLGCLSELDIQNCPYLETLPEEIGSIARLKKLKMVTTKNIATNIRNSTLISKIEEVDINP